MVCTVGLCTKSESAPMWQPWRDLNKTNAHQQLSTNNANLFSELTEVKRYKCKLSVRLLTR